MNEDLTPRQRNTLKKIADDLRYSTQKKCDVTATHKQVLQWCAAQDLISTEEAGTPVFVYTKPLLTAINQRLAQLGLAYFDINLSVSSMQQAKQGAAETKSVRESPRAHRILTAEKQTEHPSGWQIIDRDYRELVFDKLEEITVVENLDCFYALEKFELEMAVDSLVVYRGDSAYSTGRAALLNLWRVTQKPLKYFGDLDVKGFHIAQSEGFSHIAVPQIDWFKANASTNAFNAEQANLLTLLVTEGSLAEYYEVLRGQHCAILQQWLQGTPLHWCHLKY